MSQKIPEPVTPSQSRQLLPSLVKHPLTLLIAVALPQLILLAINLNAYHLISGEIDVEQRSKALWIFSGELFVLLTGIGLALFFLLKKRAAIPWGTYWAVLIPHCVYLVFFASWSWQIIPPSLRVWIVPPESLASSQFVCIMPATFLAALCLACFPTKLSIGKDIGFSAGVTLGIPAVWYLLIHGTRLLHGGEQIMMVLFVLSTLVCLTGMIRVLTMAFNAIQKRGPVGQAVFLFIVAVAGPIGGLLLNRSMGFPADFQSTYIYLLAIGNGLVLMIPRLTNPKLNRAVWLTQCLFFPFTLYFFTVFLPYLPLAVIAMLAAGAGFLILTPTLLFIVHLRKLAEGATDRRAIALGILMILVVPAYLFAEAQLDRLAIHQAIDYVYSPDFENGDRFGGSRFGVKRSLKRLQKTKKGRYLPFLTQLYNHIVLDNLVLSDAKMHHIYESFFGEKMAPIHEASSSFWGNRSRGERMRSRVSTPPPKSVDLVKLESSESVREGMVKTLVKLELHNSKKFQNEFVTSITIPDSMFVSNYWLHIGQDRVAGKIFEKKTAMWVYRMIRDATRRDPGLLTWQAPNQLSLRVFPFAADETRYTEIEFLSPSGFDRTITIGDRKMEGKPATASRMIACDLGEGASSVSLNEEAIRSLPEISRSPFFHFVVDRSVTGLNREDVIKEIKAVSAEIPEITECAITSANYEIIDVGDGNLIPLASVERELAEPALPLRGGFMMSRALKRNLSRHHRNQSTKCPLLVVLAGTDTDVKLKEGPTWLAETLPDFTGFYVKVPGNPMRAVQFDGSEPGGRLEQHRIHLLQSGNERRALRSSSKTATLAFPFAGELSVYDSNEDSFQPVSVSEKIPDSSLYAKAIAGWELNSRTNRNPAVTNQLLPEIVNASRQSGILLPDTAYIVVENSAQWKVLKQKEKKKLKGNHALDHMETPEPHWWLFLLLYLVVFTIRKRKALQRA